MCTVQYWQGLRSTQACYCKEIAIPALIVYIYKCLRLRKIACKTEALLSMQLHYHTCPGGCTLEKSDIMHIV